MAYVGRFQLAGGAKWTYRTMFEGRLLRIIVCHEREIICKPLRWGQLLTICSLEARGLASFRQSKSPALDSYAAMPHNLFVSNSMLTVVETSAFVRRAEKLLSAEEHEELLFYLALHPQSGDEIPGTGGVRKVRFAAKGKGKSGGVRVIYYFFDEENPLYAFYIYGKNEQTNPTSEQRKAFSEFAGRIKAAAKNRRRFS